MEQLTEQEIIKYLKPRNNSTGVDAITQEDLAKIDLNSVREVVKKHHRIFSSDGDQIFKFDSFTPRSESYAFKPSFAGRQVLIGREGRELYFSDGRWFCSSM